MASADGGQQEPMIKRTRCGDQEIPQDAADSFPDDGGQQQRDGSILAVPDCPQVLGGGQQMPERLTIGTKKAFDMAYPFPYEKKQIGSETIYVCTKGSEWARTNEILVLRCEGGTWAAYDSAVNADGSTLQCRQPVFRCLATDITQPGWHKWQTNYDANPNDAGLVVDWQGELWAQTRVP